jgi:pyrroline-5-carboxylate reductase
MKVGFIGGGNMARAIAGGLLAGGFAVHDVLISEPLAEKRRTLGKELPGVRIADDNQTVAAAADCIVLAVKPQMLPGVCRDLAATVQAARPLVVSIAAGVRSGDIDAWLGGGIAVVRVMPNQPALLRLGVSGLYANSTAGESGLQTAADIMAAVGEVVRVRSESDIDTVTAISGSGPAYFFLLIDMLEQMARAFGLDAPASRTLATQTATGAAALAAAGGEPMADLIGRVRSPGGTTAAALDSLERDDVRAVFARALESARARAEQLADEAHAVPSS